jgi:hypothetical protein
MLKYRSPRFTFMSVKLCVSHCKLSTGAEETDYWHTILNL